MLLDVGNNVCQFITNAIGRRDWNLERLQRQSTAVERQACKVVVCDSLETSRTCAVTNSASTKFASMFAMRY